MSSQKKISPYGAWESPVTTDFIVSSSVGLGEAQIDGSSLYWVEMRPEEKGRYVVVELNDQGKLTDRIPDSMNARTRVHEYGGGSYLAVNGVVYFSNFSDQQLYRVDQNGNQTQLTDMRGARFADFILDQKRNRLLSVMEKHTPEQAEAVNCIVSIDLNQCNQAPVLLCEGADFYSNPRLSPDGKHLAWINWQHPNMPWDDSELWLAELHDDGQIISQQKISGGLNESVCQPEWSPDGVLYFISDKNNWWNLYSYRNGKMDPVIEMDAEFGVPQWSFRESTYGFIDEQSIICTYTQSGLSYLATIDLNDHTLEPIAVPYTDIEGIQANRQQVVFLAASATTFPELVSMNLANKKIKVLRLSSDCKIDADCISAGEPIEFPTEDGQTAHAFFYPPRNNRYKAPEDELPPLMVFSHGGPTGMSRSGLKMVVQYFTSRGIAVVDVNYGGSSGYGRQYRQRLNGHWGIVDVDDCINAAKFLVEQKKVDKDRLAIRGGSAGGFTTLAALTFHDVFKAGCSRYGVSDLEALTQETHKFESRYLDNLIGPYPEYKQTYIQRSPIHATDQLSCPIIFLQGMEDKIVLPNQAEMMVESMDRKGLPVAYIAFEGEQHGFRQSNNIKTALDAEFYFFSRIFGFKPAENLPDIEIANFNGT